MDFDSEVRRQLSIIHERDESQRIFAQNIKALEDANAAEAKMEPEEYRKLMAKLCEENVSQAGVKPQIEETDEGEDVQVSLFNFKRTTVKSKTTGTVFNATKWDGMFDNRLIEKLTK